MSALESVESNGREYAIQLDAKDPLRSFRNEFLIPPKNGSGMRLPALEPARYTHWQLQTATMAIGLAFTFAETRWVLSPNVLQNA